MSARLRAVLSDRDRACRAAILARHGPASHGRGATLIGMGAEHPKATIDLEPERVVQWLGEQPGPQLIDVREPHERDAGHLAGSRHVELGALSAQAASIERTRPVIFYCRVGARSTMAAEAFRAAGYEAYSMAGGLVRWAGEGRPLSPEGGTVADH